MTRKVLYSPGFGAGWSTWADDKLKRDMLFDPQLIEAVEQHKDIDKAVEDFVGRMNKKHGPVHLYTGGSRGLTVVTVEGEFIVEEYDGNEYIVERDNTDWL